MAKLALFGAAGAIGNSVAAALRVEGREYRVVGRSRESLQKSFGNDPRAEIVTWNPDDAGSVRAAAEGVDTIVYLVGVPYNHFELHPVVMEQTLTGAIAAGVKRMVLIGTVYPYKWPPEAEAKQPAQVAEGWPRDPQTFKGKMRKAQEDALLKAHAEGKIQGTILRLPDFYGPGVEASFLHSLFVAAATGGTANMLAPIDLPHEFIYVPDVGPVVLALAAKPEAYGRWWNLSGTVVSQRKIAEVVFQMEGREPKIRSAGKMMLRMFGMFNPFMRELVEMHALLTTPLILDGAALYRLLGEIKRTKLEDGLRASLEAEKAKAAKASA